MANHNLIIDTDAGVDDAVALLAALSAPGVDLPAVTAVFGNVDVDQAFRNVGLVMQVAGRTAPLYRGAGRPLLGAPLSSTGLMGPDGLGGATGEMQPPALEAPAEHAALALVRMVRAAADPPALLALGPLTNLALAVRLDPAFASRVPLLVVMGGTSEAKGNASPVAEFNFLSDPEAAAVVLQAGFKQLWVLPWETSTKHLLLWEELDHLSALGTPRSTFFGKIVVHLRRALQHGLGLPGMPLPDMLAAAAALDPAVVTGAVDLPAVVETAGPFGRGMLALDWNRSNRPSNIRLITDVNFAVVKEMISAALSYV